MSDTHLSSDLPRPQDADASEPVTDVDQEVEPTPQGRVGDPAGLDGDSDGNPDDDEQDGAA